MVGLLSRRGSAPKPYDTPAAPAELQARPEPPQVLLDIGATTDRLDAAANVVEERVLGVPKPVIDPPAVSLLFYQARSPHQLEVSAGVRLRHLQRLNELTHAKTFLDRQQAAG